MERARAWTLPPSLWTATASAAADCRSLEGEHRADVCIVGGGFTGLSAALHLAELGAGVLQPLSYGRGLAGAAQRAGARIHGGTLATGLRRNGTRWAVGAARGVVLAPQVVLATNAYTDLGGPGGPWPGLAQSLIPVYSYIAATKPLPDTRRSTILPKGQAVSDTRHLLRYFRLDPAGRMLMGGRGKFRESSDPADYRAIMANARELYPQLGEADWEFVGGARSSSRSTICRIFTSWPRGSTPGWGITAAASPWRP